MGKQKDATWSPGVLSPLPRPALSSRFSLPSWEKAAQQHPSALNRIFRFPRCATWSSDPPLPPPRQGGRCRTAERCKWRSSRWPEVAEARREGRGAGASAVGEAERRGSARLLTPRGCWGERADGGGLALRRPGCSRAASGGAFPSGAICSREWLSSGLTLEGEWRCEHPSGPVGGRVKRARLHRCFDWQVQD